MCTAGQATCQGSGAGDQLVARPAPLMPGTCDSDKA